MLDDVLVDPFSGPRDGQLGDDSGQTQGGVVSQRHVADLPFRGKGRVSDGRARPLSSPCRTVFSACLVGVEAVVDEGADVVQVERSHLGDPPGGVLKGCQTDVEVDLVQVPAVKRVQLETRRA